MVNISSKADSFFASDRDIEVRAARAAKINYDKGDAVFRMSTKVLSMFVVPGAAYIAESGSVAKRIELETGKTQKIYKGHNGPVTSVALFTSGNITYLFTGSWDKTIRVWNAETQECISILQGHADFVKSLLVIPTLGLFSGSSDATIRCWNLSTYRCERVLKGHTRSIESMAVDPDGQLFSASSDRHIRRWDAATGEERSVLQGHDTSVYWVHLEGEDLWSASADKRVLRWDLETEKPDTTLEHPDYTRCVVTSGPYVFTGCSDGDVRVWDIGSGALVTVLEGHFDEVSCMQIFGTFLYTGSLDGTVRKWSITTREMQERRKKYLENEEEAQKQREKRKEQEVSQTGLTEEEERELAELMSEED
ncbi:uncharacterized protein VTP21DRAFT_11662 [Calcarisporiella thermophila]|uniref:uncharacterized protein n=1 Tax=Calcarisporiella thermophila TaxID=911321 RepID=UPI003744200C